MNMHMDITDQQIPQTTHMTRYADKCNKYDNIVKICYNSAWRGCDAAGYLNICLPRHQKRFPAFPKMLKGMFKKTSIE